VGERIEFSFTEHDEADGSVRVCLVGELDAVEAPDLQDALRRLEREGTDVLLDVSGLSFMDLLGLHVVEEAADAARQDGFGFAIAGPVPDAVRQVFVEAGAQHHLPGGQARLAAVPSGPQDVVNAAEPIARDRAAEPIARDHAAAEHDQTRSDRDQTLADTDQTHSDRDQAAADADQAGSDRDQVAADSDQLAADSDEAASEARGLPHEPGYEHGRDARRRTSRERDETADMRARISDVRDSTANHRDATAAERDITASQRDLAAYGRDRLADIGDLSSSAEVAARRARGDRQRAQTNRELAARDREQAARDREEAAVERGLSTMREKPYPAGDDL
jgi:anti-anti-sigma factor